MADTLFILFIYIRQMTDAVFILFIYSRQMAETHNFTRQIADTLFYLSIYLHTANLRRRGVQRLPSCTQFSCNSGSEILNILHGAAGHGAPP